MYTILSSSEGRMSLWRRAAWTGWTISVPFQLQVIRVIKVTQPGKVIKGVKEGWVTRDTLQKRLFWQSTFPPPSCEHMCLNEGTQNHLQSNVTVSRSAGSNSSVPRLVFTLWGATFGQPRLMLKSCRCWHHDGQHRGVGPMKDFSH